jgi:hypothetical protein
MPDNKIDITVRSIKEIEFFVDEEIDIENQEVVFDLAAFYDINFEEELLKYEISPSFSKKGESKTIFMKNKVSTIFHLKGMKNFKSQDGKINLPDQVFITVLSISITHARALLAKSAAGTRFSKYHVPIVNPVDLYNINIKRREE